MDGFTIENGYIFPEMDVFVVSKQGDTVLQYTNMLGGLGQPQDIPALNGSLILAYPIISGQEYTAKYRLFDTKGEGEFFSEMDFEIVSDPVIKVKENGLQVKEVYVYNEDSQSLILGGEVHTKQSLSLNFRLLKGYQISNNCINLGMAIKVVDARGRVITETEDALENTAYSKLGDQEGIRPTLTLTGSGFQNPVEWTVRLWDKNGNGEVTARAQLQVINP